MTTHVESGEIAVRLILTILAGGLIGFNREEHGRAAGLCTMILVCLAAAISMIMVNLMMATAGRHPDSFIMLDLMRLPLGILSGMGFIGAGAILRRGSAVLGVTTAATLWFVTVMGLCFGAGEIGLGLAMLAAGIGVLWLLKWIERRLAQDLRGVLVVASDVQGPSEGAIREQLSAAGFQIASCAMSYTTARKFRRLRYELLWRGRLLDSHLPLVLEQLAKQPGVRRLQWKP
ncbi:MAG TPA: MgtC/SapB family protein [Pirellulales bacterium]|jgi:putative Mg2+ transporter-C (MgtC) family protein|nr:MgtC/SapB family protein [Pirellulales bacterium]